MTLVRILDKKRLNQKEVLMFAEIYLDGDEGCLYHRWRT